MDCGMPATRQSSKFSKRRKNQSCPCRFKTSICMKSASWRANACTCWSSRRMSRSICARNSVFMLSLVNCDLSSAIAPSGSRKSRANAGLRSGAFKQDAVEDLNLIKMVALGFKELPALVDSCFHNRVVIGCERYVGVVRFEEVLVNMEAWIKCFER